MSVKNDDLQAFLNTFNEEIEEGSGKVTILAADNVDQKNIPENNDGDENRNLIAEDIEGGDSDVNRNLIAEDIEGGTFYMDDEGNCYYQSYKEKSELAEQKLKEVHKSTSNKPREKADTSSPKRNKSALIESSSSIGSNKTSEIQSGLLADSISTDTNDVNLNKTIDTPGVDVDVPGKTDAPTTSEVYNFDFDENNDSEDNKGDLAFLKTETKLKGLNSKNVGPLGCVLCSYTTDKRFLLSRHMKSHSNVRPYKCSVCERGFKTNPSLLNHVNTHLGNKPHSCKWCNTAFTTSGELVRHVRYKHTGEKPHKCTECEYASVELSKLRRHIRCHTGERPYQCPHCTYASPDTFKLKRHLRTHTGEKPYECDICNARFTQSNSLKSHKLIHSVVDKPVFQCPQCPTTCGRKTDLRLHIQNLHQSDKPIACKRCGKELPDRYSYKLHIKTHEGEKCYRCKFCSYASTSVRHLDSHMFIHTNEKPFACELCGNSFRQRQLLKRHINLYHNIDYVPPKPREKQHTCPTCKRLFTHKGNLIRHMELHDPSSIALQNKYKLKVAKLEKVDADDINMPKNDILIDIIDQQNYEILASYESNEQQEIELKPLNNNNLRGSSTNAPKAINKLNKDKIKVIKKEHVKQEIVTVDVEGEQKYMVLEVIEDDDDDYNDDDDDYDDDNDNGNVDDVEISKMSIGATSNSTKIHIDAKNCFGFENEDELEEGENDEDYYDYDANVGDDDSKDIIQFMHIIDECS